MVEQHPCLKIFREQTFSLDRELPQLSADRLSHQPEAPSDAERLGNFVTKLESIIDGTAAPGTSVSVREFDNSATFEKSLLGDHQRRHFFQSLLDTDAPTSRYLYKDDRKGHGEDIAVQIYPDDLALVITRKLHNNPKGPKSMWYATLTRLPSKNSHNLAELLSLLKLPTDGKYVPSPIFEHP